jgi:phage gp16-like protein
VNAVGVPARFDRATAHRRGMLAKVHIAKVQLQLSDDDYVAILLKVAGRESAKDCSDRELHDVLKHFEARGFTAKARTGAPKPADHPMARKARALWISLYQLGAVNNPAEAALEAFACRQLGCAKLQWANQAHAYKLIEALKAMAQRHGWDQSLDGVQPRATVIVLKRRLVEALAAKLAAAGLVPSDWRLSRTIRELTGIECGNLLLATTEELDRIAKALGAKLRAHAPEKVAP